MKILLNLLPEEKKAALVRKFRHRFLLWQTTLVFLFELYYILMLVGIVMVLQYQVKSSQGSLDAFDQFNDEARKLISYQETFKQVNAEVAMVTRYQDAHLHWGALFTLLGRLTPDGVVIVELLTKDYMVSIVGQARTREQFLDFEAALKESECISDVRVPISNLFSQKEVDFQLDFKLKSECLIQP